MLDLYWHIGENIVNNFKKGEKRAKYGEHILKNLSIRFTLEYGKGYSLTNMKNMRMFYLYYQKSSALLSQLSWSHYLALLKTKDENIRNFLRNFSQKKGNRRKIVNIYYRGINLRV